MKRFAIVIVLGLIGFFTLLVIFSKLGRRATDDDPFLDPMANPNIRVAGNWLNMSGFVKCAYI